MGGCAFDEMIRHVTQMFRSIRQASDYADGLQTPKPSEADVGFGLHVAKGGSEEGLESTVTIVRTIKRLGRNTCVRDFHPSVPGQWDLTSVVTSY